MTADAHGWRPIESADRNGATMILATSHISGEGYFDKFAGYWVWMNERPIHPQPTHWQPLPAPPLDAP